MLSEILDSLSIETKSTSSLRPSQSLDCCHQGDPGTCFSLVRAPTAKPLPTGSPKGQLLPPIDTRAVCLSLYPAPQARKNQLATRGSDRAGAPATLPAWGLVNPAQLPVSGRHKLPPKPYRPDAPQGQPSSIPVLSNRCRPEHRRKPRGLSCHPSWDPAPPRLRAFCRAHSAQPSRQPTTSSGPPRIHLRHYLDIPIA